MNAITGFYLGAEFLVAGPFWRDPAVIAAVIGAAAAIIAALIAILPRLFERPKKVSEDRSEVNKPPREPADTAPKHGVPVILEER